MKIMQVITDYIMKSILTTRGDMVVRGVSVPEKLAGVAIGRWFGSGGVGVKPFWTANLGGAGTKGDLITRGTSICERVAAVAVGQVLKSAGVGEVPVWDIPFILGMNMTTGSYNFGVTGSEAVTGLGFKPGFVVFVARDDSVPGLGWSAGLGDGTAKMSVSAANDDGVVQISLTNSISLERTSGNIITGSISVMGGDGFTVAHVLTGTCVTLISWFAIG